MHYTTPEPSLDDDAANNAWIEDVRAERYVSLADAMERFLERADDADFQAGGWTYRDLVNALLESMTPESAIDLDMHFYFPGMIADIRREILAERDRKAAEY